MHRVSLRPLACGIIFVSPITMLEINTIKVAEHRGCKVYIRNFHTTFEYLVFIKGELYTAHMIIKPQFTRMFSRKKYSSKQLTDVTKYLLNIAEATIEHVLGSDKTK